MKIIETPLKGLFVIEFSPMEDDRGFFMRTYCKKEFASIDFTKEFVQFNHSFNKQKGTVRGMHFQNPPFCETKLVRCVSGSIYDVVVDIRKKSPTFLQSFSIKLSDKNAKGILIPEGFAHGFQTLKNNTSVIYHHTEYYQPNSDGGLKYNDEKLNIQWPLPVTIISEKDNAYPLIDKKFKGIETNI